MSLKKTVDSYASRRYKQDFFGEEKIVICSKNRMEYELYTYKTR